MENMTLSDWLIAAEENKKIARGKHIFSVKFKDGTEKMIVAEDFEDARKLFPTRGKNKPMSVSQVYVYNGVRMP